MSLSLTNHHFPFDECWGGSGHCRQFLCELPSVDNMVFLSGRDPSISNTMDVLLPHAFTPDRLLDAGGVKDGARTLFGDLQPEVKTLPWPRLGRAWR